jgi:hypothetical protein
MSNGCHENCMGFLPVATQNIILQCALLISIVFIVKSLYKDNQLHKVEVQYFPGSGILKNLQCSFHF